MSRCRSAGLQVGLMLISVFAAAAVRTGTIRVTILDSETHSVSLGDNGVPKNCDGVNYDAYCLGSKTSEVTNILLVREGDQPAFRVSCAVDTKWSRCMPLPKGSSYDAKRDKRGLIVYYVDDNGKVRKQLYAYVGGAPKANPAEPVAERDAQLAPSPVTATPVQETPKAPAPVAAPAVVTGNAQGQVKCSFSSTPAGAEITVDGQYVGSTPSTLSLSVGVHVVEVSLPGFVHWKRELTVSSGSELTVNAVLEKAQ
jgi:hypothetical protein